MKHKILITLFLIVILMANISLASYSTVTMEVVEEPVATIPLGENSKFEKKLVGKDLKNKEVTLELKVTNDEIADKPSGEIIFVLDNSDSMLQETSSGKTRKELIFESAQSMISSLLKDNKNLQIGVVSFSANVDPALEGTIDDASIVSHLSTDASALNNAISKITANGPRTDLQSGLLLANQEFSDKNTHKYMIVLTDGIPNVAINYDKQYYSDDVINKTINQFKQLENKGVIITTMLTKVDDSYKPNTTDKTFGQIISEIFGSTQKPNFGKFYYIPDDKIEKTMKEDIYNSLIPESKTLKNIKIVDYFPDEIIKNFDFSYVSKANIGEISANVDTTNNSITWTIPELEVGKTAVVQYKLKLKQDFDSSIVDKLLNTNKQVDVEYTDYNGKNQSQTSTVSPKLKLTEPPAVLPQTGISTLVGLGVFSTCLILLFGIKLININKKLK